MASRFKDFLTLSPAFLGEACYIFSSNISAGLICWKLMRKSLQPTPCAIFTTVLFPESRFWPALHRRRHCRLLPVDSWHRPWPVVSFPAVAIGHYSRHIWYLDDAALWLFVYHLIGAFIASLATTLGAAIGTYKCLSLYKGTIHALDAVFIAWHPLPPSS